MTVDYSLFTAWAIPHPVLLAPYFSEDDVYLAHQGPQVAIKLSSSLDFYGGVQRGHAKAARLQVKRRLY